MVCLDVTPGELQSPRCSPGEEGIFPSSHLLPGSPRHHPAAAEQWPRSAFTPQLGTHRLLVWHGKDEFQFTCSSAVGSGKQSFLVWKTEGRQEKGLIAYLNKLPQCLNFLAPWELWYEMLFSNKSWKRSSVSGNTAFQLSVVSPLLFWRGFSSQRSCSFVPTSWQEVRQEMPICLCFLGMVLLTSLPPSKQELFLWHWQNRMVELDRNQFRSSQQKLSVRHLAHVEVMFICTFFFHFFFPPFLFCHFVAFYLNSLLFSKQFPWRTRLNAGFIMHRSSEMTSIPPVLCCSPIRWFPKSSLSAV